MCITKNNRGFTLIELLVAGLILVTIALAVFSTFAAGIKVYKKVESYGTAERDILLFLEGLERDLRNTLNYSGIDFIGENKKISWAGLVRQGNGNGGNDLSLGRISYYFDAKTDFLSKKEQNYSQALAESDTGSVNPKIVISIKDVSFSYYYFNLETQEYNWNNFYNSGKGIPQAVRIIVTIEDENKNIELVRTVFIPVAAKPVSQ